MSDHPYHIAVDLDGTLAQYDGFRGRDHIGAPIPEMVRRVRAAIDAGNTVWIFTSRAAPIEGWMPEMKLSSEDQQAEQRAVITAIQKWCEKHIGVSLPVTAVKWRIFSEFWDDRAYNVHKNAGYMHQRPPSELRQHDDHTLYQGN
jgi:hypothetical protein